MTVEKIVKVSEWIYRSEISTVTSVLFGVPSERSEDMQATLNLMRRIKTDVFDVHSYMPLPGTPRT